MKQPPIKCRRAMIPIMAIGWISRDPAHADKAKGILVTARKWPKIMAPAMINMTMHVIKSVSFAALINAFLSFFCQEKMSLKCWQTY